MASTFHEYRPGAEGGSRLPVPLHGIDRLEFLKLGQVPAFTVEDAILNAPRPIDTNEREIVSVLGQTGVWANKRENENWRGEVPLSLYPVNDDPSPQVVHKKTDQYLVYNQEVAIRYLRPPTPPPPGEIILKQERNWLPPVAPPLVIRQQPPRPETPPPVVVREAPPPPPAPVAPRVIPVPGKRLPPPPRKVVVERLPQLPVKPQPVIIERWLPYKEPKRRVIFERNEVPDPIAPLQKNVVVQWETPEVFIKKDYKDLGVVKSNPFEYVDRFGETAKPPAELPEFVREIRPPVGVPLAAEHIPAPFPELEGDIEALRLIDLDREGLSQYKRYIADHPNPDLPRDPPKDVVLRTPYQFNPTFRRFPYF